VRFENKNIFFLHWKSSNLHTTYNAGVVVVSYGLVYNFWSRRIGSRGRCYDHNFLRFSAFLGEKIGVFLKKTMLWSNFA
jgi:hypothetical protein